MNKMVARKTIVSLLWYLLIGWAVWIIVNFIEKTVSALCPGHFGMSSHLIAQKFLFDFERRIFSGWGSIIFFGAGASPGW